MNTDIGDQNVNIGNIEIKQDENIKDTFLSANEFIELASSQEFSKIDIEKIILGLQKIHSETKKVA